MKQYGESGHDTGASSDFMHTTRLVFLMVASFGTDDEPGHINLDGKPSICQDHFQISSNSHQKIHLQY